MFQYSSARKKKISVVLDDIIGDHNSANSQTNTEMYLNISMISWTLFNHCVAELNYSLA